MKKIIVTWSQKYKNIKNPAYYWGLGDMLRGSLELYRYAKQKNIEVKFDTHLHPLSNFTENSKSEFSDYIDNNLEKVYFFGRNEHDWKNKLKNQNFNNDIICCMTNNGCVGKNDYKLSLEEKKFIKSILEPNSKIESEINNTTKQFNENFTVFNARFSDEKIKANHSEFDFNKFKSICLSSDIVISNSTYFKQNLGIPYIDKPAGHIGYETDLEKIKNAFIQFHILSKSKLIRTYSDYSWISGYALWASLIYDVELQDIKTNI